MNSHNTIYLNLPASFKHLGMVRVCLAELLTHTTASHERIGYIVQLAIHEACANIVKHAYAGQSGGRISIILTLAEQPHRLLVELHDTGAPYTLEPVTLSDPDTLQEHGYGRFLMDILLDDVAYIPGEGGNTWRLVKLLDSDQKEPV